MMIEVDHDAQAMKTAFDAGDIKWAKVMNHYNDLHPASGSLQRLTSRIRIPTTTHTPHQDGIPTTTHSPQQDPYSDPHPPSGSLRWFTPRIRIPTTTHTPHQDPYSDLHPASGSLQRLAPRIRIPMMTYVVCVDSIFSRTV